MAVPRTVAETMGQRMQRARKRAGLSVDFMAEHFGVSVSTIRSWEQSVRTPRGVLDRLQEWAELCAVSYGWLLKGDSALFTYSDLCAVEEHQLRLPFDLPRSVQNAVLSVAS